MENTPKTINKSKKKPKFKHLMADLTKSKETNTNYLRGIKMNTGGGHFTKIDKI